MDELELKRRTKQFALRVMKLMESPLLQETNELTAIMVASRKSAQK